MGNSYYSLMVHTGSTSEGIGILEKDSFASELELHATTRKFPQERELSHREEVTLIKGSIKIAP